MTLKLFSIVFLIFLESAAINGQPTQHHTISGYVKEAVTGESLIGVNIYLSDHKTGTSTNTYGFYSITIPATDTVELTFSYVGFTTQTIKTSLQKDIELNIDLKPGLVLNEVTVTADRIQKQSESVKMSTVTIQA